jgi:hypothetical protein
VRPIPGFVEPVLLEEFGLIQERQNQDAPTVRGAPLVVDEIGRRESAVYVMVVVERKPDLFEIILTLRPQ